MFETIRCISGYIKNFFAATKWGVLACAATPEVLLKNKEWARFNLDIPVAEICNDEGFVIKKVYGDDSYRLYKGQYEHLRNEASDYQLWFEKLPDGTTRRYAVGFSKPHLIEEVFSNGAYKKYDKYINERLLEERTADGTIRRFSAYSNNELLEETYVTGGYKKFDSKGNVTEEKIIDGNITKLYKNGHLVEETLADGTYREYSTKTPGLVITEKLPDGTRIERYNKYFGQEGDFIETTLTDGSCNIIDKSTGRVIKEKFSDGSYKLYASDGKLIKHVTAKEADREKLVWLRAFRDAYHEETIELSRKKQQETHSKPTSNSISPTKSSSGKYYDYIDPLDSYLPSNILAQFFISLGF